MYFHLLRQDSEHETDLGKPIVVITAWQSCLDGADVLIEASRLPEPEALYKTAWIKPGTRCRNHPRSFQRR
jgi:hypothetical protein